MMLNRITSVSVNAAWPAANEMAAGATQASRIVGGSTNHNTVCGREHVLGVSRLVPEGAAAAANTVGGQTTRWCCKYRKTGPPGRMGSQKVRSRKDRTAATACSGGTPIPVSPATSAASIAPRFPGVGAADAMAELPT